MFEVLFFTCWLLIYIHLNATFNSVDATYDNHFGKYVNDSPKPNCVMRSLSYNNSIHLCLFALKDIQQGEELRYSYGVSGLPWRKVCYKLLFFSKYLLILAFC